MSSLDSIIYRSCPALQKNPDQVLSPTDRPDPCQPGDFDFTEHNLALGMPAQASRPLPDQPASGAVDGTAGLWWGTGAFAPQWLLIYLGTPRAISALRLLITQSPAGDTLHQVWVGASIDELYLIHTFECHSTDGQVLDLKPESPIEGVRYLRVNTRWSPSWVGWKWIEVLAPQP